MAKFPLQILRCASGVIPECRKIHRELLAKVDVEIGALTFSLSSQQFLTLVRAQPIIPFAYTVLNATCFRELSIVDSESF